MEYKIEKRTKWQRFSIFFGATFLMAVHSIVHYIYITTLRKISSFLEVEGNITQIGTSWNYGQQCIIELRFI